MDDLALLREYAARQSETAFTMLVERHIGLVYCAALRQARDPALAQEITQVVFILLARKAHTLRQGTILSAWLYRAARFAASDARKMAFRRQQREQEAAQMQTTSSDHSSWKQIAPLLDQAMAALGEKDRNAVMLRFFEEKSLEEVGVALGIDTGAAQKRVWRAVDKLRRYFSRHGAAFSAEALTAALSAHAVHAVPSGLASAVAATAALKGAAATSSTATLIKGTLKLMAWTKAKIIATAVVGVLLATATATITVKEIQKHNTPIEKIPEIFYPWQTVFFTPMTLRNTPPQVTVVPTKFGIKNGGGGGMYTDKDNGSMIGMGMPLRSILWAAFTDSKQFRETRMILKTKVPDQEYDFIANLPSGSKAALAALVKKQFGLAGHLETRETQVLDLRVASLNAPGLKPDGTTPLTDTTPLPDRGEFVGFTEHENHWHNQAIGDLANWLEWILAIPVMDKTGLTNNYDMDLKWPEEQGHPDPAALKQALLDQLSLELVPTNMPVEMLVVEKAK